MSALSLVGIIAFQNLFTVIFLWGLRSLFVPPDQLEIQHENRIQHWHQQQSYESRDGQAANLRVTQRFPKWTAMHGQGHESQHGSAHCNHYRAQPNDRSEEHTSELQSHVNL